MTVIRRHKRVTVSGRMVTVRQHTRDTGRGTDGNERRPAAEDAAPAPNAAKLPPPEPREDAETWWDDDEPRPEPWMDTGEDEPEHSPAFAAMLEQNPDLGRGYEKTRLLRESGYAGAIDQDGEPVDRWELAKTRARIAGDQEKARKRFSHAKTIAERDGAGVEFKTLGDLLKALPEHPAGRR